MTRPRTTPPAAPATEAAALFATVSERIWHGGPRHDPGFSRAVDALDALVSLVAATEQQRDEALARVSLYISEVEIVTCRARAAEQQRDEALAIVRGEQIETINESATRTLHATLDRAEAAERRAAETDYGNAILVGYLERIDYVLTTVDGDNHPQGEACKMHARQIARAALSAGGPERTTT